MRVELAPRIVVDPAVRFGKPVIAGTRVPVELMLGKLAGGMSVDDVSHEYEVSVEDIRAALLFAARVIASEEIRGTV